MARIPPVCCQPMPAKGRDLSVRPTYSASFGAVSARNRPRHVSSRLLGGLRRRCDASQSLCACHKVRLSLYGYVAVHLCQVFRESIRNDLAEPNY
ncbi:hypothetical protein N656DRAFT_142444 [Canariomyces notabilis]|uniref:Uncharacterized protein n=1 Tax=Canariomyces notabilis TaxID=2074819 RepID=A0AAN6TC35_9PEZI|nr:hypothetical protein N656DRAFT_142444 [Canariomyces arenarius]